MSVFGLIFFAAALNVDAFNVGISYGIRDIKVPLKSLLTIVFISMGMITLSMTVGHTLVRFIPEKTANIFAGAIFIIMGLYVVYQSISQRSDRPENAVDRQVSGQLTPIIQFSLLGIIVRIQKEPHLFDVDNSGTISVKEALLLGTALSLDSLATGIAISFIGCSVVDAALLVGLFQLVSLSAGLKAGVKLKLSPIGKYIGYLPGLILMVLGLTRFTS